SCSMSVFATVLLVETLLSFACRTICLCPLLTGAEHVAERRRRSFVTSPFQGGDGGAPQRRLLHGRESHGARQRVGDDLHPRGRVVQRPAGGDDLVHVRQEVGDRGEGEADALERRLPYVEGCRREGEAVEGAGRVGVPACRPLAAEEGQEGQSVGV